MRAILALSSSSVWPQTPDAAFKRGALNRVPIITGANHDEGRFFVAEAFDLNAIR
jgi:carboxylesterase type B